MYLCWVDHLEHFTTRSRTLGLSRSSGGKWLVDDSSEPLDLSGPKGEKAWARGPRVVVDMGCPVLMGIQRF